MIGDYFYIDITFKHTLVFVLFGNITGMDFIIMDSTGV